MPDMKVEDFIVALNDRQVGSKDPALALFYRMHKEMAPQLLEIIQETRSKPQSRQEMIAAQANFIEAYTRFIASSIDGIGLLLAGSKPEILGKRRELAQLILEGVGIFLDDLLEKTVKTPNSNEGTKPHPAETP